MKDGESIFRNGKDWKSQPYARCVTNPMPNASCGSPGSVTKKSMCETSTCRKPPGWWWTIALASCLTSDRAEGTHSDNWGANHFFCKSRVLLGQLGKKIKAARKTDCHEYDEQVPSKVHRGGVHEAHDRVEWCHTHVYILVWRYAPKYPVLRYYLPGIYREVPYLSSISRILFGTKNNSFIQFYSAQ